MLPGLLNHEIQELPLRHEHEKLAMRGKMSKVAERDSMNCQPGLGSHKASDVAA